MNTGFRHLLIFVLAFRFLLPAGAQEVWPGDVNNNGIVNGVDLLYLGLAYNSEGPERTNGDTEWQAQPITAFWPQSFPNGLNYAYADGDGDGSIDDDDKDAIEENFSLTHGTVTPDVYANAAPGAAPRIFLEPGATVVQEGAQVSVGISIGDLSMPVNNFYGIAFKLSFDAELLADDDGIEYAGELNSWIAAGDGEIEELFMPDETTGTAELAVTRTNQQAAPAGSGRIGAFSIIIEDIIVGLSVDTFNIRIDSVLLLDHELGAIPLVPDSAMIIIARDPKAVSATSATDGTQLQLFPNPGKGPFFLRSGQPLSGFSLHDKLGRRMPVAVSQKTPGLYQVQATGAPPGLYFLTGCSPEGCFSKKMLIQP